MRIKILFFFLCSLLCAHANDFYKTGERSFDEYHGPYNPELKVTYKTGEILFEDDVYKRHYPMDHINNDILPLYDFFQTYLSQTLDCPDDFYFKNKDYLHYLYRLTTISHLYEYLRQVHISLYQMGELEQECSLDYDQLFGQCSPKSKDMKSFLKRVDNHFFDIIDWGRFSFLPKNATSSKLTSFHGKGFVNRLVKSDDGLEASLNLTCHKLREQILSTCSETDSLYGMSRLPKMTDFIKDQSAYKIINSIGAGKECIQRFKSSSKHLEVYSGTAKKFLNKSIHKDYRLFFYGALREFDELGIEVIKSEEPEIVEKVEKVEKKDIEKKVVKEVIKEKRKRVVIRKSFKIKENKKDTKTALEKAVLEYVKSKKPTLVDLEKAKSEYQFSKSLIKKFNGPLRPYQTIKALKEMRQKDTLGSIGTPFSYLFLRYLLDYELHQGLFNLQTVLGKSFYIIDDIKKVKKPVKVKLINNKETNYQWKLFVEEVTGL